MNAMTKIVAAIVMTGATSFVSTSATASWWDSDNRYDRWHGGPWYGGYPGWGGYPAWGWSNYPGPRQGSTIIVIPGNGDSSEDDSASESVPEPRVPH
jgi:hypothetical protein